MHASNRSRTRLQLELLEDRAMLATFSIANLDTPGLIDVDAIQVASLDNDQFCPRQVSFEIPGTVGVQVTATENGGSLDFTVDVLDSSALTGDLRGLFFHYDESKLGSLEVTGGDGLITGVQVSANAVINLGNGNNLQGAASPFDLGIAFGTQGIAKDDISGPVHFTLTNAAHDLTTDDFAHLQFGARVTSIGDPAAPDKRNDSEKIVEIAPAAPKAHDDVVSIFEDGASGLDDPRHSPTAVLFNVLANDIADDPLSVIAFHNGPSHGTVAIAPNGDVVYTPHADYAGTDSFEYCVSDRPGSQDSATASIIITAVADVPEISVQVSPGATVHEINLHVTAAATDIDGSEYIDRFEFTGMPDGVVVLGAPGGVADVPGTPGMPAGDFTLVLQPGRSYDFELAVKAYSKELSNGDEEAGAQTIDVVLEYKTTSGELNFQAQNQSIWNPGGALGFEDRDRFLGFNPPLPNIEESLGPLSFNAGASLKAGFESDLQVNGGSIDATLPYNITINTTYNKTTDVLLIDPSADMASGAFFETMGPKGSYKLDFIFNYSIGAAVELDAIVDTITLVGAKIGSNNMENIVDISSNQTFDLDLPFGLEGTVRWPEVDTRSGPGSGGTLTSSDASNDFLNLQVDVVQALADIFLGGVNPLVIPFDIDLEIAEANGTVELIGLDLSGGLNFVQTFTLQAPNLEGQIAFENGSRPFNTLTDITLPNASSYDANGDGVIDFDLALTPNATLRNETDLGINLSYNFDLLKVTGHYDIGVDDGPINFGIHEGGPLLVETIDLYSAPAFDLNFPTQGFDFLVGSTLATGGTASSLTVAEAALTVLSDPSHFASSVAENQVVDLLVDPQASISTQAPLFATATAIAPTLAPNSQQHTTATDSQLQQSNLTTELTNNDLLIRVVDLAFEDINSDRSTFDDDLTSLAVEPRDEINRSSSIHSVDHLFAVLIDGDGTAV